jgi:hypothetical protein
LLHGSKMILNWDMDMPWQFMQRLKGKLIE